MAPTIKIDGAEYDFPDLESLTLDEAVLLERHAGVTLDQLAPGDNFPLGAVKGLIMVAIKRVRQDVSDREISDVIGRLKLTEVMTALQKDEDQDEADADPPQPVSSDASSDSTQSSGANGSGGSELSPEPSTLPDTGPPASAISSASDPVMSVVSLRGS